MSAEKIPETAAEGQQTPATPVASGSQDEEKIEKLDGVVVTLTVGPLLEYNRYYIHLTGNTYPHRNKIKSLGYSWDRIAKWWEKEYRRTPENAEKVRAEINMLLALGVQFEVPGVAGVRMRELWDLIHKAKEVETSAHVYIPFHTGDM